MGHNGLQLLKDSFILEKETVEGDRERGALVPPLLSHGGHRHDISEPERTGILDMPTALPPSPPLAIPLHPLPFEPPLPSFLAPASLDTALGPDELGPLPLFACETKPLRRKREEAESFTWYQPRAGMAASAFPSKGPSFC